MTVLMRLTIVFNVCMTVYNFSILICLKKGTMGLLLPIKIENNGIEHIKVTACVGTIVFGLQESECHCSWSYSGR